MPLTTSCRLRRERRMLWLFYILSFRLAQLSPYRFRPNLRVLKEHRLVELWTKRSFRCDCPTVSMQAEQPSGSKRRKCVLNRPEIQPSLPNEKNRYSKNFHGKFCRCGRDYDPETEEEAMLCCLGCEVGLITVSCDFPTSSAHSASRIGFTRHVSICDNRQIRDRISRSL